MDVLRLLLEPGPGARREIACVELEQGRELENLALVPQRVGLAQDLVGLLGLAAIEIGNNNAVQPGRDFATLLRIALG